MRKYGCFQAIIKSFYSRDFYRDVVANWGVGVVLYLLLILSLSWLIPIVKMQKALSFGYSEYSSKYAAQIPDMTIKQGELSTPQNRPYLITDPDTKKVIAIIDTSGKYQSLNQTAVEVLVTKQAVFYQNKSKLGKSHEFDSNLNMEIKPIQLNEKLKGVVSWFWLFLFPFFVMLALIYRIAQGALYAIVGEVFAHISKVSLTYGEIFKITLFAITPAVVLDALFDILSIHFAYMGLLYFILSMGYIWFGILANKK